MLVIRQSQSDQGKASMAAANSDIISRFYDWCLQDCQRILARIQREQAAEEQARQDVDQAEILKV